MKGYILENKLLKGPVLPSLLRFSLPFLFSYFLQMLYGMADLYIIAQFDDVASVTGVSIGGQFMHFVSVVLIGLAMGSTVRIAQAIGRKEPKEVAQNIGNSISLFTGLSLALTALLLLLLPQILSLLSTPEAAMEATAKYLGICIAGIPFITGYNILSSIFRATGDSKSPLLFVAIACVLNIALDYLFIGYFRLGTTGAALATTIAQASSMLVAGYALFRKEQGFRLEKRDFRPQKPILSGIVSLGLPIALQDGFIQLSFLLITIIANQRGLVDAAAVGIVEKLIGIFFLVPSTLLQSVSALAAQNIGAGQAGRAKQTLYYALLLSTIWGLSLSLLTQVQAEGLLQFFTKEPAVLLSASAYLRGYVWDCIFAGIHFCFSGYFCAIGRSGLSFLHNAIAIVLARIPLAYFTSLRFPHTLYPMGLGTAMGSLLSVVICVMAFVYLERRGKENKALSH